MRQRWGEAGTCNTVWLVRRKSSPNRTDWMGLARVYLFRSEAEASCRSYEDEEVIGICADGVLADACRPVKLGPRGAEENRAYGYPEGLDIWPILPFAAAFCRPTAKLLRANWLDVLGFDWLGDAGRIKYVDWAEKEWAAFETLRKVQEILWRRR